MASVAANERGVSIGRILSRGFATVAGAPVATLGIAFLFSALPGALFNYAVVAAARDESRQFGAGAAVLGLMTALMGVVLSMLVQGALVRATVAHSRRRRAGFAECAAAGLRVILPLLLLGVVVGFAVMLGFMLLVVPGVMIYVALSVAAPALVEERRGVFGALGRSRELTKGARWNVFALFNVMLLAYWLLSAAVGVLGVVAYGGRSVLSAAQTGTAALPLQVAGTLVQTVVAALWGTIQTSLYVELRDWKDGPAADALADIFA